MKPLKRDQLGFFNAAYADIPIRDQRDTMERPFFSLAKKPRKTPIEYEVGGVIVKVYPIKEFGIATIWDVDILSGPPRRSRKPSTGEGSRTPGSTSTRTSCFGAFAGTPGATSTASCRTRSDGWPRPMWRPTSGFRKVLGRRRPASTGLKTGTLTKTRKASLPACP